MVREEQEQQEEQQPQSNMPYYQPTIMPSEKADLFDKIKPEVVVEHIRYMLMGYEFDKNRGIWIYNPVFADKALTQVGAWQLSTLMLPVSSKNVTISKLEDDEIRARAKSIVNTAMKMCLRNWKEYGIKSRDQIFFVKEIVLSNSFITLKHPEHAGVRSWLGHASQEIKSIHEEPKKGGFISSLFRHG